MNGRRSHRPTEVGGVTPSASARVSAILLLSAGLALVLAVVLGARSSTTRSPASARVEADPVPRSALPAKVGEATVSTDASVDGALPTDSPIPAAGPSGAWPSPATESTEVVLVGDSLAQEIAPVLAYLLAGRPVVPKFWGGTAPCDWTGADLEAGRASVVVISFTGNSLTPCMGDGRGGHLDDDALVARYRADIGTLVEMARSSGARVVLVGQPYRSAAFDDDAEVDGINAAYQADAAALAYVSFVDAGAAVERPDGSYADRLPCAEFDIGCGTDGTVVVRGDGVHFCPVVGENPCSVWSSGALRFALAIADAVDDPGEYEG